MPFRPVVTSIPPHFGRDLFVAADKWIGTSVRPVIAPPPSARHSDSSAGLPAAGTATIGSVVSPAVEKGVTTASDLGAIAIGGSISRSSRRHRHDHLRFPVETSLEAFFAGIIPGLLLAVLISVYVYIRATLNKDLCPVAPPAPWRERWISLTAVLPVGAAFLIIFGGMYAGVWSAIEAAPVGAVVAFVTCVAYRRLTWGSLMASIEATLRVCAMIYMIILSAYLLNYFVFVSKLDRSLVNVVSGYDLPGWAIMVLILVVLTVLGCIFDVMALIIISTSIYLPMVKFAGYDPVWFGIILVLACELALITPPVGINLYIVKDLAPRGTPTSDIIRGAFPYVFLVWGVLLLFIAFPEIVLWLPSKMKA